MTDGMRDLATRRLAVDLRPEGAELESWRETFGRAILRLDVEPMPDQPFRSRTALQVMPGFAFASVSTSACRTARTLALVKEDGRDDFGLVAVVEGTAFVSQRGRNAHIKAGEAVILRNDEAGAVGFPANARYFSLAIPAEPLTRRVPGVDGSCMTVIPAASGALRLALRYADLLLQDDREISAAAETHPAIATHFYDLAAAIVGGTRDAIAIAEGRGVRAARLKAIKADIAGNLARHDLSVADIAARHGITPRYVGRLFECEGTTFSHYVLEQRLSHAHRMLSDPRYDHQFVSVIAIDSGFGDISYFNRSFRRYFGATPSDVREAARQRVSSVAGGSVQAE